MSEQTHTTEYVAISELVTHERQARDRGWWTALERCYAPDATLQSSWFDGTAADYIEQSTQMFEHTPSSHLLGQPVIDVRADRALAEVPMTIEFRGEFRGVEVDVASRTRMVHRVVRNEARWRLLRSTAVFERDTMIGAVPGETLRIDAVELAGLRPSYRMLSLWMTEQGYPVPADRYGVDRPGELAQLYQDARDWVGITDD